MIIEIELLASELLDKSFHCHLDGEELCIPITQFAH